MNTLKKEAKFLLRHLADDSAASEVTSNAVALADAGAISPLVHLLKSGSHLTKKQAAKMVLSMSKEPAVRLEVARAGALPPLQALQRCDDDGAQRAASAALLYLKRKTTSGGASAAPEEDATAKQRRLAAAEEAAEAAAKELLALVDEEKSKAPLPRTLHNREPPVTVRSMPRLRSKRSQNRWLHSAVSLTACPTLILGAQEEQGQGQARQAAAEVGHEEARAGARGQAGRAGGE